MESRIYTKVLGCKKVLFFCIKLEYIDRLCCGVVIEQPEDVLRLLNKQLFRICPRILIELCLVTESCCLHTGS